MAATRRSFGAATESLKAPSISPLRFTGVVSGHREPRSARQ